MLIQIERSDLKVGDIIYDTTSINDSVKFRVAHIGTKLLLELIEVGRDRHHVHYIKKSNSSIYYLFSYSFGNIYFYKDTTTMGIDKRLKPFTF